jgi:hypothetical protein
LRLRLAPLVVGLVLVAPAPALATKCAPPGTSGVSQYIETIPGGSCNRPPPEGRTHGPGGALPHGAKKALTSEGPAGQQVARLVARTGTAPERRTHQGPGGTPGLGLVSGQGWQSGLLHPVLGSGSGGPGMLLPLLLGVILLVMLVAAAFRRPRTRARR